MKGALMREFRDAKVMAARAEAPSIKVYLHGQSVDIAQGRPPAAAVTVNMYRREMPC
jgi:hypothetical protein